MLTRVHRLLEGDRHDPDLPECDSMSLRLEKFVRIGDNTKKDEIQAVVGKCAGRIAVVKPKGAISFTAKLGGRLIINQAGGVLENAGLCIHPHYNAPYIPGSAVKGCARHAAWQSWDETQDGDSKIKAAKEVAEIFGFPTGDDGLDDYLASQCGYGAAQSGKVAFLAAVPETTARLVVDLVNCHHKEYYAGNRSDATDDESPIPNFFPAVEAGSRFVFTLAPCGADDELLKCAKHWLVVALRQNGIGAKTAAGYGWFEYDEVAEAAAEEKRNKEAAEKEAREKAAAESARLEAERMAAREKRASMGVLERWGEFGAAAVCGKNGRTFVDAFARASDEVKTEMVRALQSADGIGFEVWKMIRTDKKRKNQDAVSAVFKWAKDKGLGRMPQ